jgi:hypothetical protein
MLPEDKNYNNEDFSEIDEAFDKAMRTFGYLFPETEDELESLKAKIANNNIELPKELDNPYDILKRGKITTISAFNISDDSTIEENMAMAAREGKILSEDIINRMNQDRKEAEDKDKADDPK